MIELQSFQEKVYGNLAVVYHRTSSVEIAKGILTKGFMPGSGAMYGKGLYTTYDIDSQLNKTMASVYGNIILKLKISLYKFLVLDREVAKVVYGKNYKLVDQWIALTGKSFEKQQENSLINELQRYDVNLNAANPPFTSIFASELIKYHEAELFKHVNGVVFTGKTDGRVAVVYNYDSVTPISYIFNDSSTSPEVMNLKPGKIFISKFNIIDLVRRLHISPSSASGTNNRTEFKYALKSPVEVYLVNNDDSFYSVNIKTVYITYSKEWDEKVDDPEKITTQSVWMIERIEAGTFGVIWGKSNELQKACFKDDAEVYKTDVNDPSSWTIIKSPQATQRAFQNLMKGYHS